MLVKRRALLGIALCTAVLSSSYPMLLGFEAYPQQVFYGRDVFSITPASSPAVVDEAFAASLANQSWAVVVSPEVYAFSSWNGVAVVARGVDPAVFLKIEEASLIEGAMDGRNFVLAGERLALRRDASVGSSGILAGSTSPAIVPITVTGIFRSSTPSADEVLIPLDTARKLIGLHSDNLGAVRLRTNDAEAMMDYLRGTNASLAVASGTGTVYLNTPRSGDGRLSSLIFLYPEFWGQLGRNYVQSFAQQGVNGVRVVVLAFLLLLTTLAVVGIYAVVWRATAEAGRSIGILRVVGGTPGVVTKSLLKEFLVLGSLSILAGLAIGYMAAEIAGSYSVFLIFSHAIRPQFDAALAVAIYVVALAATTLSGVFCARAVLHKSPRDLITGSERRKEELIEEALPI